MEGELADVYASPVGRPSYPVGVLLRTLLLQAWYGLSDPMAEEAFKDRLSFWRFLGVTLDQATPDHNTLWRFGVPPPSAREELARRGLAERLLAQVNAQLAARGLVLKQGTLIDASLIEANVAAKNTRRDGRPIDPDARPPRSSDLGSSGAGASASCGCWAKRKGGSVLGYKMHVAVDEGSGLVRALVVTGAEVHDSRPAAGLVQGDEGRVLADKAYDSAALRQAIRAGGAKARVMHKARRNTPLQPWQRWMNKALTPARGAVERIFGTAKRSYRCDRARLWNGPRNTVDLTVKMIGYNLRRALNLPETSPSQP